MGIMMRTWLALTLSLLLLSMAGCGRSFTPATPDAGVPAPDAGPCAPGIAWLDDEPIVREADLTVDCAPAITADAEGFLVVAVNHSGVLDLADCLTVDRLPDHGPAQLSSCTGLGHWEGPSPRLFASTDPSGRARLASLVVLDGVQTLRWSRGPVFDTTFGSTEVDGEITIDRVLGAVAFEDDAVLVEEHELLDGSAHQRSIASRVTRHRDDGSEPEVLSALDPALGGDFWAPTLATTAEGPWLAIVNDVDFPPTVQAQGPRGGGWDGSSCGVESYEIVAESASDVVVSADCGDEVLVERRRVGVSERDRATLSARDEDAGVRSRITGDGEGFAVVYRGDDGMAHVAVLDHALATVVAGTVPGTAISSEMIAGPLGIAAMRDGTYAVMTTTHRGTERFGDLAVHRFRVCR